MSSLTLTYLDDLSRVRIEATDLPAGIAIVERSTDQIRWTTVRGGTAVPVVNGAFKLDDYEFADSVENFYRVRPPADAPTADLRSIAVDTATDDGFDNQSVTPPAGVQPGDVIVALQMQQGGSAADMTLPSDFGGGDTWHPLISGGFCKLWWKVQGDTLPPFYIFRKSTDGACVVAVAAISGGREDLAPVAASAFSGLLPTLNPVETPSVDPTGPHDFELRMPTGQVQAPTPATGNSDFLDQAGYTKSADAATPIVTSGSTDGYMLGAVYTRHLASAGQSGQQAFAFDLEAGDTDGLFNARGFTVAVGSVTDVVLTASITVALDGLWLKSLTRPFLNRKVALTDFSEVERASRNGVFPVVGRSYPVAVTDLRMSRQQTITIMTDNLGDARDFDVILSSGDPMFLHAPATCGVDTMYVVIGDTTEGRRSTRGMRRYFDLPLTEVAAPDPSIVGSTVTWQGVLNAYATWRDVIAANATWAQLMDRIGDPTDVIVP
ncbi:hypothetical protein [Jiangella asiatica]|uniref:Uncharacterized protein n=1 Tax=Jiangella asiatica TaxID=2530372 RepID=A0A4R5CMW0_9ACTN|nr:hypothetical protein [Jiangella asiatica]TDD98894.1 hypothetical protein E1269_28225 [Jiangella asiatica]